jgi:3-hydroxypropanoate dehydrogenase
VNADDIDAAARRLFTDARTCSRWLPQAVDDALLRELYRLASLGPTSMNSQPMRLQFAVSAAARERLAACVNPGNVDKVRSAPVVAIVGQDLAFVEQLAVLFAHKTDARSYYDGKPDVVASTALRNSSLQGGYLILAARLLGLDCGPMSGFDAARVDREFWAGSTVRTNFLCALGHGDRTALRERPPRLAFEQACAIV